MISGQAVNVHTSDRFPARSDAGVILAAESSTNMLHVACREQPENQSYTEMELSFFILDSRRVLHPAPGT